MLSKLYASRSERVWVGNRIINLNSPTAPVSKMFLYDLRQIPKQHEKAVESLVAQHLHDILQKRLPVELDHGLRTSFRIGEHAGTASSSQNDCLSGAR